MQPFQLQSLNTLSSIELDKQEVQKIQVRLQAFMAVQLRSRNEKNCKYHICAWLS